MKWIKRFLPNLCVLSLTLPNLFYKIYNLEVYISKYSPLLVSISGSGKQDLKINLPEKNNSLLNLVNQQSCKLFHWQPCQQISKFKESYNSITLLKYLVITLLCINADKIISSLVKILTLGQFKVMTQWLDPTRFGEESN